MGSRDGDDSDGVRRCSCIYVSMDVVQMVVVVAVTAVLCLVSLLFIFGVFSCFPNKKYQVQSRKVQRGGGVCVRDDAMMKEKVKICCCVVHRYAMMVMMVVEMTLLV